ncbi:MAG TPA: efflux RND transporter periplasmic adaptor subunit, partial [Bacteroidia bacterium]|nr:efflux RND transporter periplasmic adaptor subunit [Bacteroidia bacterium]
MTERKLKRRRIIIAVVVALLAVVAGLRLASNKKKITEQTKVVDRSTVAIPVSVTKAFTGEAESHFSLPAVLEAESESDITLNTSGRLQDLKIELGSNVRKGQVLGSIDNSLKQISLESTQLLVDKYEKDYQRAKELFEGRAATEVEVSNAKYNYENAKLQAAQIKQQIADGTLTAPSGGVIVAKNFEEGEFVNAGTPVATVIDVNHLKASVRVSESDVYRMETGMRVLIHADVYPGQTFEGVVRFISPQGDDNHNYKVEIAVENKDGSPLKAGTFVHVDFDLKQKTAVLQIPKTALVEGLKNPYVYTVANNRAEIRKIVPGREIGDR